MVVEPMENAWLNARRIVTFDIYTICICIHQKTTKQRVELTLANRV